eukprot:scpid66017/ scgid30077/ G kinase-anchoring protein 1
MHRAGIPAEKSRFAALKLDSSSDSDDEPFVPVAKAAKGKKTPQAKPTTSQPVRASAGSAQPAVSSASVKNAKRRAKKKNKQTQGSGEPSATSASALSPVVHGMQSVSLSGAGNPAPHGSRSQATSMTEEEQYQRDLEAAMVQSNQDAESHHERLRMAGMYQERPAAGIGFASSSAPGATPNGYQASIRSDAVASSQSLTASARDDNGDQYTAAADNTGTPEGAAALKKEKRRKRARDELNSVPMPDKLDPSVIERAVKLCMDERKKTNFVIQLLKDVVTTPKQDLPFDERRIAEVEHFFERKASSLSELIAYIKKLEEELLEANQRNKQVYGILTKGEMSKKSELVQQVEDLTARNKELTEQFTDVHSQLEQERSRAKTQRPSKKA